MSRACKIWYLQFVILTCKNGYNSSYKKVNSKLQKSISQPTHPSAQEKKKKKSEDSSDSEPNNPNITMKSWSGWSHYALLLLLLLNETGRREGVWPERSSQGLASQCGHTDKILRTDIPYPHRLTPNPQTNWQPRALDGLQSHFGGPDREISIFLFLKVIAGPQPAGAGSQLPL